MTTSDLGQEAPAAEPRFSVVVPVFNRAGSLRRALDSILQQSRQADEIIVVDDGSSDDPFTAIADLSDRVVFLRQDNAGVASARNLGCRAASGNWLTFLDSDDLWQPDRLEILARDLRSLPQTVVAHLSNVLYFGADHEIDLFKIKGRGYPLGSCRIDHHPLSLVASGMTLQGAAIQRDLFNRLGGFDPGMPMLSDTDFFCRLAVTGPFAVTGDVTARIERLPGDGSSITGLRRKQADLPFRMTIRTLERLLAEPLPDRDRRFVEKALSGALFNLATALRQTDPSSAREALRASMRRHPSKIVGFLKAVLVRTLGRGGYDYLFSSRRFLDRS